MAHNSQSQSSAPQSSTNKDTGNWGEGIAADYLRSKGYNVCERNWRSERFEIDIIAQYGTRIVFVEVKTRSTDMVDPVSAVDNRRRQRMINAADAYLKMKALPLGYQFDIVTIVGNKLDYKVEHTPDAFMPTPRTRRTF